MNERLALQTIESQHGSVEEFVVWLFTEQRDALDETISLTKRAEMVGLPLPVFSRLLTSARFRELVRADIVNRTYSLQAEEEHFDAVKRVAVGLPRTVATAKGDVVEVDQNPTDVMQAGRYLNEARGTPMESRQQGGFGGVTIIIGSAAPEEADDRTIEIAASAGAAQYKPRRAGELPPAGTRARLGASTSDRALDGPAREAGLGTLYGRAAEEADEDTAVADKVAGRRPEARPEPSRELEAEPIGYRERRERWSTVPHRVRPPAPPSPGRTPDD